MVLIGSLGLGPHGNCARARRKTGGSTTMSKRKNTKETSDDEGSDAGIDEIVEEEV